ncbi:I10R1 protein, partial [Chloroceryle aenea]|nr:I10R1 protein [Chloroceryle aenea]
AALALCTALLLAWPTAAEKLAKPRHVHFAAEIAHHLLQWEPGQNAPSNVRYEVEYTVYGMNVSWMAIPKCTNIPGHSCDLTYYTEDPARRYYVRVRAVSGNLTSPWKRTNAFSPQEATLRLPGQSLSVKGNTIHVQLQLLFRVGNLTIKYDDIQKRAPRYQPTLWSLQHLILESTPEFSISSLFWNTEYCVSVEPTVASRRLRTTRTDEQCVTIGDSDRSAELVLSISTSSFITLVLLGLLGVLMVCTYIKKPVRPPSVLKSFIKQSSLWVEEFESSSSGSPDADPVQQLFLCQKEPQQESSPVSSTSTAQLPPEKSWRLPSWPKDWASLLVPGAAGQGDSSCTSTDSGICLHTSFSELSCSSGPEPQGYKRQLPIGDDSGVSLESTCPHPTDAGNAGPTEARLPHRGELSHIPAADQEGQQDVEFRGYLQQSKGTVQPRQDPAGTVPFVGCAGSPQDPSGTGIVLDVECTELAVVKGYLKQSSPEHPCSHTQDLAPWGASQEPTAWDFAIQMGSQAPTLLSYGAPGAPLASKSSPEFLKAPFDMDIFNTDLLVTLPIISNLSTSKLLTLQANPLSVLSRDSKDSRL